MSAYDTRYALAQTKLAAAKTANSNQPVTLDQFIAQMFPNAAGAGMGERLGYRVLARNVLGYLVAEGDCTRSQSGGFTKYA